MRLSGRCFGGQNNSTRQLEVTPRPQYDLWHIANIIDLYNIVNMTTLYIVRYCEGIGIFTDLSKKEAEIVGNIRIAVTPGEDAFGLTYDQLEKIASTTGRIDSVSLPVND